MKRRYLVRWIRLAIIVAAASWHRDFALLLYASMAWNPLGLMYAALATTPCAYCNSGTQGITNIQVDLSGVTNSLCSDCANFNTTFILTYDGAGAASGCQYSSLLASTVVCGGASADKDLIFTWTSGDILKFRAGPGDTLALWASPLGAGPVDCQSATSLSAITPYVTGTGIRCTTTGASATITPLP